MNHSAAIGERRTRAREPDTLIVGRGVPDWLSAISNQQSAVSCQLQSSRRTLDTSSRNPARIWQDSEPIWPFDTLNGLPAGPQGAGRAWWRACPAAEESPPGEHGSPPRCPFEGTLRGAASSSACVAVSELRSWGESPRGLPRRPIGEIRRTDWAWLRQARLNLAITRRVNRIRRPTTNKAGS